MGTRLIQPMGIVKQKLPLHGHTPNRNNQQQPQEICGIPPPLHENVMILEPFRTTTYPTEVCNIG